MERGETPTYTKGMIIFIWGFIFKFTGGRRVTHMYMYTRTPNKSQKVTIERCVKREHGQHAVGSNFTQLGFFFFFLFQKIS